MIEQAKRQPRVSSAMSSSNFLEPLGFSAPHLFFVHLQARLSHAMAGPPNESSLYGYIEFILEYFASNTKVGTKDVYLGLWPQKELRLTLETQKPKKTYRSPDFCVLFAHRALLPDLPVAAKAALIWEVKRSNNPFKWSSNSAPIVTPQFLLHFEQVCEQVQYARDKFPNQSFHVILSIDVWFVLLYFPGCALAEKSFFQECINQNDDENSRGYVVVPPSSIFNKTFTEFSQQFLYALHRSVREMPNMHAVVHQLFRPKDGTEAVIADLLKQRQWFAHGLKAAEDRKKEELWEALEKPVESAGGTETDTDEQEFPFAAVSPDILSKPRCSKRIREKERVAKELAEKKRVAKELAEKKRVDKQHRKALKETSSKESPGESSKESSGESPEASSEEDL